MIINLDDCWLAQATKITEIQKWDSKKFGDRKEPYFIRIEFDYVGIVYTQEWSYAYSGNRDKDFETLKGQMNATT